MTDPDTLAAAREPLRPVPIDEDPGEVHNLATWVQSVRSRLRRKYDCLTVITGDPGVGKSHAAYYLGRLVDPTMTVEDMVFSGEVFIRRCETRPPFSSNVWDEIVEGGLSIDAITAENRRVLKHLITGRSLYQAMFANAPSLDLFQRYTREGRAHWWVHLARRGVGTFHRIKKTHPYPGAKTYYEKAFIRTNLPPMPDDVCARYERLKSDWRLRWHRDSKRYIKALNAKEQEDVAIGQLVKSLSWLPRAVDTYATTFPGHRGKLKPWEEEVQRAIAHRKAPA